MASMAAVTPVPMSEVEPDAPWSSPPTTRKAFHLDLQYRYIGNPDISKDTSLSGRVNPFDEKSRKAAY